MRLRNITGADEVIEKSEYVIKEPQSLKGRYKELFEEVKEITQKTLTVKLRELEEKQLITREVFPEIPPKVVYSLTPIGERLRPLLKEMYDWGIDYVKECGEFSKEEGCVLTCKDKNLGENE